MRCLLIMLSFSHIRSTFIINKKLKLVLQTLLFFSLLFIFHINEIWVYWIYFPILFSILLRCYRPDPIHQFWYDIRIIFDMISEFLGKLPLYHNRISNIIIFWCLHSPEFTLYHINWFFEFLLFYFLLNLND